MECASSVGSGSGVHAIRAEGLPGCSHAAWQGSVQPSPVPPHQRLPVGGALPALQGPTATTPASTVTHSVSGELGGSAARWSAFRPGVLDVRWLLEGKATGFRNVPSTRCFHPRHALQRLLHAMRRRNTVALPAIVVPAPPLICRVMLIGACSVRQGAIPPLPLLSLSFQVHWRSQRAVPLHLQLPQTQHL